MSRSHHIDLDQAETSITRGRRQHDRRRAQVEEQIAVALADGDGDRVSRLRELLDTGTEAHE